MLQDYYLVEAGWNYCLTRKRDIKDLHNKVKKHCLKSEILKLHWECFKLWISKKTDFRVVYVDATDKLWMKTRLCTGEDYTYGEGPIISTNICDIYIMKPDQTLQLKYSVNEHEIEHWFVRYDRL